MDKLIEKCLRTVSQRLERTDRGLPCIFSLKALKSLLIVLLISCDININDETQELVYDFRRWKRFQR